MAAALSQERTAAAVIVSAACAPAIAEASAWASDTSAQTPTQGSAAAAAAAFVVGPSPSPLQSMEKWRRPLSREFGPWGCERRARRLGRPGGCRSHTFNHLGVYSAPGCTEWSRSPANAFR